jgi:hypothetical protein
VTRSVFAGAMVVIMVVGIVRPGSVGADVSATGSTLPLVGTAYAHWATFGCSVNGAGIVATYDQPGVRKRVRLQLAAMRAAGLDSLRLLLWHMSDISGQDWGVVPSAGGRLVEPYRANLIDYLADVRATGFEQLTVSFAPEWTNDPDASNYDPSLFDENWQFIRDIRPLVKQYGPASTHIDLLNEGAPSDSLTRQASEYVTRMYANYVSAFGSDDVTVSAGFFSGLQNLIDALRASGKSLPQWFEIHPHLTPDLALHDLQATDATLTANGLTQPLVIGEEAYDNAAIAAAIQQFRRTSSRPILEVLEWPLRPSSGCRDFSVSPPFRSDAYISALNGSPPSSTLTGSLDARTINLQTPQHDAVTALEAGSYRVIVTDSSARTGFHLVGPGVNRKTGIRFRGAVTWRVNLRAATYRYRADPYRPELQRSFVVLKPG